VLSELVETLGCVVISARTLIFKVFHAIWLVPTLTRKTYARQEPRQIFDCHRRLPFQSLLVLARLASTEASNTGRIVPGSLGVSQDTMDH